MYFEQMQKKIERLKGKKDIVVLGIESSCDETSIAVVKNGREVLSNVISSQIDIHKRFGGVVPEVASRNHVMAIPNVLDQALLEAGIKISDIDAIAVTYGAGLIGALMVGVCFAKSLAYALEIPLISVSHIHGHMCANFITYNDLVPPFVGLIVSGGHTAIVEVKDYINFKVLGSTLDDAVGECLDKVARVLGLEYPGGPKIDKLGKQGNPTIKFSKDSLKNSYDSSFSGLKTATINFIHNLNQKNKTIPINDICASLEKEAFIPLINKTIRACKDLGYNKICVAGGVSANSFLRENLKSQAQKSGIEVFFPDMKLCTDNAAMIASQGYFNLLNDVGLSDINLDAVSNIAL